MRTLVHLANFNSTNIGNGALIFGLERVLREDLDEGVRFLPEAWDDYTFGLKSFDEDFVSSINRSDGLIVGAAVTLNGRDYLANAGMRFDLPYESWPKLSKPIVFYGISYRVWPNQPYHHLDKFKRAMNYILSSPHMMFSVRNDGTKSWLEALLGYKSENIEVVPDPAVYVPVNDSSHPELKDGQINMLLSLNNEDESWRFRDEPQKKEFLSQLAAAVENLAAKWDLNVILCPHYFDDYKIMAEFMTMLPPRIAHQKLVSSGLLRVSQAPYFYDLYSKADIVLSMRIHSMSPAIGLGLPMLALSSQKRMAEFLNTTGLQDFMVNIFEAGLQEKVESKVEYLLTHGDEVRAKFHTVRAAIRDQTRTYNRKIAALLERSC